ncbi:uncharacterized protein LOC122537320, partial [Frieseomelitta varia]|uniref:uncharacterized protein LOC122537320 n=1 Tax=Frieseomelitta varia TaxID=561572 RepID=UPI001CB6AA46
RFEDKTECFVRFNFPHELGRVQDQQDNLINKSIIGLAIILFHHIHHHLNRQFLKEDESVPHVPEEANPIFLIYFLCMLASLIFANIWIFTDFFMKDPRIVLIGCFVAASLMLTLGIIEMKHVDWYLDITLVTDEELLEHPIFIHNFVMCLMSIFCMSMYLIQGWILLDYCLWIKKQRKIDDSEVTDSETRTDDTMEDQDREDRRPKTKEQEVPGELDPIPTLDTFPSLKVSATLDIDKEDIIFYCCFVDWYNYLKQKRQIQQPTHEFQVIHVM